MRKWITFCFGQRMLRFVVKLISSSTVGPCCRVSHSVTQRRWQCCKAQLTQIQMRRWNSLDSLRKKHFFTHNVEKSIQKCESHLIFCSHSPISISALLLQPICPVIKYFWQKSVSQTAVGAPPNPAAYGALMSVISAGLNWTEHTESFFAVGA